MSSHHAGDSTALSRDLADFLIEFSIALHKYAIYPPGHPLLSTAVRGLLTRIGVLLKDERGTLSIGVARRQLIIEGVATDPNHPLLRELAQRLHRHHLGAVRFAAGITNDELSDFCKTVSIDAQRMDMPLGLGDPDVCSRLRQYRRLHSKNREVEPRVTHRRIIAVLAASSYTQPSSAGPHAPAHQSILPSHAPSHHRQW